MIGHTATPLLVLTLQNIIIFAIFVVIIFDVIIFIVFIFVVVVEVEIGHHLVQFGFDSFFSSCRFIFLRIADGFLEKLANE